MADKLDLPDIGTLGNPVSARAAINTNFTAIENAFDNTLSRDGAAPNQMEADIDMNGNDLLNVKRIDADELYKNGVPFEQTVAYANKNYELLSGTGSQTNFTLSDDPGSLGNLYVSVAGLDLKPGIDYTYSGTTLTFISAPAAGTNNIYVRYDRALPVGVVTADLVSWSQPAGPTQSVEDDLQRIIRPEHYGADATGVTLSDAAFATCAALGKEITLKAGATYYLSQRVVGVTGTRFICKDGIATVKLKTGSGGFNNVALNSNKDTNAVFYFSAVDDIGVSGVRFTTDGTKEVTIYPVRILAGCTAKGADIGNLWFSGLSLIGGGYVSLNSIGGGGVRGHGKIIADACGSAAGNAYWTGTPQVTVVEVDNDLVGGVHSVGNAIVFDCEVGARNVLLTGQAKTDYGQETDCVNIAGISGTDRKGPVFTNIWADGVGEVLDCFCGYGDFHVSRARNVHKFVVKMIHGARGNNVTVGPIESYGLAAVTVAGSNSGGLTTHTANNVIRLSTVRGAGDSGDGPSSSDVCAVLVQENSGAIGTCLPRANIIEIADFIGSANCDYVVKDNCSVDNDNANVVIFKKPPVTYTTFGVVTHNDNTRVRVQGIERVEACLSGNQTPLTSGVDTTIAYAEVITDRQSQHNVGTYKTRLKYPGMYNVRVSIRGAFNSGDDVTVKILKNAAAIRQVACEPSSGALAWTYTADKIVEVTPDEAGTASADISGIANITSAGTITLIDTNSMTFLEVTPLTG